MDRAAFSAVHGMRRPEIHNSAQNLKCGHQRPELLSTFPLFDTLERCSGAGSCHDSRRCGADGYRRGSIPRNQSYFQEVPHILALELEHQLWTRQLLQLFQEVLPTKLPNSAGHGSVQFYLQIVDINCYRPKIKCY